MCLLNALVSLSPSFIFASHPFLSTYSGYIFIPFTSIPALLVFTLRRPPASIYECSLINLVAFPQLFSPHFSRLHLSKSSFFPLFYLLSQTSSSLRLCMLTLQTPLPSSPQPPSSPSCSHPFFAVWNLNHQP